MNKLFALVFLIVLPLLLCACAPGSVQGLREEASIKEGFDVQINYQEAYRRIITPARACFQGAGLLGPTFMVQGDLFNDIKKGEIVFVSAGLTTQHPVAIDIVATGENASRIESFLWYRLAGRINVLVKRWVNEQYNGCEAS